jgi:geranylgeranyl diphosphate synthase type II
MMQTDACMAPSSSFLMQQCEEELLFRVKHNQPCLFHLNSGGNRSRAKLCVEAGIALDLPSKAIIALACSVELLHNASLIHDDLQDAETVRRGRQSVWRKYGKSHAICAGDYMISAAFGALADVGQYDQIGALLSQTNEAVLHTIEGQSLDIDANENISEQEYESIASMKSGPLIQLTLTLPLIMSGHQEMVATANQALHKFAIAYQIVDDLDDYQQDAQRKQLNLINLLAAKSSMKEALYIARNRAQYLLKQCEKELVTLPNNCAESVLKASRGLLAKSNVGVYE